MCGVLLIYSKKKKLIRSNCIKAFRSINNRGPDKQLSNLFLISILQLSLSNISGGDNIYVAQLKFYSPPVLITN